MISIRDIAMIAVGALGTIALSKYKEPLLDKMDDIKDSAIEIATDKLDNMK